MDCSTPGLPVPHHLTMFAQVYVHCHWWCHPAISSSDTLFSFCPQFFPVSGTFLMSRLFASDDQNPEIPASALLLPTSFQNWSPLRLTGVISLLSKGLSGVISSTTSEGIKSLVFCLYSPAPTTIHDHWEDRSHNYTDICHQSSISALQNTVQVCQFCQEAVVFRFHGCSHCRSDSGAQEEICHYFHLSPSIYHEVMWATCHDLSFFNI